MIQPHCDYGKVKGETKMKCFNSFCPFRTNDSNDEDNCVCEYCPNRVSSEGIYASDRTVISDRGSYRNDTKAE